jgi:hypothetical protein
VIQEYQEVQALLAGKYSEWECLAAEQEEE